MRTRNRIIKGVSDTSKMSYREIQATGRNVHEADYIYSLLKESPRAMTSREISKRSKIERTNVTRTLYDLIDSHLIKVERMSKCPVTYKTVKYYTTND